MSTPSSSQRKRSRTAAAAEDNEAALAQDTDAITMAGAPPTKRARKAASAAEAQRHLRRIREEEEAQAAEAGATAASGARLGPAPSQQRPSPPAAAVRVARPPRHQPSPSQQQQSLQQPRRPTQEVQEDEEQAQMRFLRMAQARQEQKKNKKKAPVAAAVPAAAPVPSVAAAPVAAPVAAAPVAAAPAAAATCRPTAPPPVHPSPQRYCAAPSPGTNGTTAGGLRAPYAASPPQGRPVVPPPRSSTRGGAGGPGGGGDGTSPVDPAAAFPAAAPAVAVRAPGPDLPEPPPPGPFEAPEEEVDNHNAASLPPINTNVPPGDVHRGRPGRTSQPESRSWLGIAYFAVVSLLAVYLLSWRPAGRPSGGMTTTTAPRELPLPHSPAEKGVAQPCFRTFPTPQDTEDEFIDWNPRCPKYLPDQLVPCPPRAVCRGGQVVACESNLWIPADGPANGGVVTLSDSTAATTTKTRPEWPTRCVLSEEADVLLSSVVSVLEAWTIRTVCPLTDTGGSGPNPSVSYDDGSGDDVFTKYPRFLYDDVMAELDRRASDANGLQDMLLPLPKPDEELFQDLAEGRLELRLVPTATSAACSSPPDTDTTDEAACLAAAPLWIGLTPQHQLRLPHSCQVGKGLAELLQFAVDLVLQTVWFLVLLPFFRSTSFLFNVVLVFFREMPLVYSIATLVGSLIAVVTAAQVWKRRQDRQKQQRFREIVDHTKSVAVDVLRGEEAPLPHLALRDAVRETMGRAAPPKGTFNKVVWPATQSELERDRRVAVYLRQGERELRWIGPKAN